jgi:hypothetical protein
MTRSSLTSPCRSTAGELDCVLLVFTAATASAARHMEHIVSGLGDNVHGLIPCFRVCLQEVRHPLLLPAGAYFRGICSAALWASDMLPNMRRCHLIHNCMCLLVQDFTFVCPTEITAFSDAYNGFKELDCEVRAEFAHLEDVAVQQDLAVISVAGRPNPVRTDWFTVSQVLGVSVDSQFSHLAWIQTGDATTACHTLLIYRPWSLCQLRVTAEAYCWSFASLTERKEGGVGDLNYPLVTLLGLQ